MKKQVVFLNDTTLDVAYAKEVSVFYDGAQRIGAELQFLPSVVSYEKLKALTENISEFQLLTQDESTNVNAELKNYGVRTAIGCKAVLIADAEDDAPAIYEERLYVVLAKRTYQELQLQQLQATVDALVMTGLEG